MRGDLIAPQEISDDRKVQVWVDTHRSAATRAGYEIDIRAFRACIGKPLHAVSVGDIQDFAATLDHLAPATVARRLSAVKSLIKFLHRLGWWTERSAAKGWRCTACHLPDHLAPDQVETVGG